jgi:hypothetical protein
MTPETAVPCLDAADNDFMLHMNRKSIGLLLGVLLAAAFPLHAKEKIQPCWYMDANGLSKHLHCLEPVGHESFRVTKSNLKHLSFEDGLATVKSEKDGWLYVNRQGNVVISGVPVFDNGPDWFHDGLVRFERHGKCGFANRQGVAVVPPEYGGCLNFQDGIARACMGCHSEVIDKKDGHSTFVGGEWFCLDASGQRVPCAP